MLLPWLTRSSGEHASGTFTLSPFALSRKNYPKRGPTRANHCYKGGRHQCPYCPYSSDNPAHVKAHSATHTGEKSYACHVCCKKFSFKISRDRHLKDIHEGQRNHRCQTCGLTFQRSEHLRAHERKVHGSRAPEVACGEGEHAAAASVPTLIEQHGLFW